MSAGEFMMGRTWYTVIQHDTGDLRRIQNLLHNGPGNVSWKPVSSGQKTVTAASRKTAASAAAIAAPPQSPGKAGNTGGQGPGGGPAPSSDPYALHSHAYVVSFENANPQAEIVPDKPEPYYNNYFIGDKKNWASNCPIYQSVTYRDLYPNIDLHYYTNNGFLKYDLIVRPGGDLSKVVMDYMGQNALSVNKKGQLQIQTSVGMVKELAPVSYQLTTQGRSDVPCKYIVSSGNRVSFSTGPVTSDATLVIDPTEVFCSFTGSKSDNWGYTATYDNGGNFYAGGIAIRYPNTTDKGNEFGATPGAYQSTFQGGDGSEGAVYDDRGEYAYSYDFDVAIMKFNSSGSKAEYATYLGGTGDEQPHSLICDPQGNLIVTGRTTSTNFPNTGSTVGQGTGFDIFVTKFNATGTGIIGSHRIGGEGADGVNNSPKYVNAKGEGTQELRLNYGDDGRGEVFLDAANNIYVATSTQSAKFYTTPGVFQPAPVGGTGNDQDGVLIKFSPDASSILASTYLGGSAADAAFVLRVDPGSGNIYVGGGTLSSDFPGIGNGPVLHSSIYGGVDGFISLISPDFRTIKSTYIGTGSTDMIYGLDLDKTGDVYVDGITYGVMPVINSPFNQNSNQVNAKQFITKLKPDLSSIIYSTNFGNPSPKFPNISPTAILVDRCENVYVSGWGGSIDAAEKYNNDGVAGMSTTSGAIKANTDADAADFYFFVLKRDATSQLYGSYFGQVNGNLGDHVDGGTSRFDAQGVIYQAICANCNGGATFPTTTGVWARTNGAVSFGGCNEAAVKIAFNFAGVAAGLKSVTHGRGDSVGCVPLNVSFSDTLNTATSYIWNFGDGSPSVKTTSLQLDHTYTSTGNFLVTEVAIDSNSCNVADTAYRTIEVKSNPASLDFRYDKIGLCTDFNFQFTNLSTHAPGAPDFTDTSFVWNFGDASPSVRDGVTDKPVHVYTPGPYHVILSLVDTNYCNYPADTIKLVYVAQNVKAQFTTPAIGCAPYTAIITNTSIAGQKFYYDFGDGSPIDSIDYSPTHLYPDTGTYTISVRAVDSATCNITDTYSFTIVVKSKPRADFTFSPEPPQPPNTPTVFTDASSPGIRYEWIFGDGTSEVRTTPDTVVHLYIRTDTFNVCLVVTNETGCTDTACHAIPAVINPLLDVPNAFTPGRFGQNAVVKVVGFGITHMTWRIYNRWGQMVFESINPYIGWDGTYKGTLQPMDVYAYSLEAEFSDGTHATKKGDITLIR
jgi:gliding motility-associated-like protein